MKHAKAFAVFALTTGTLLWACTGVFVKHFALADIDPDVQNLYRYISATIGLWAIVLWRFGGEAIHAWRRWPVFLIPTAFNCAFQTSMVGALYHRSIYPAFNNLLAKSSVLFAVVLAFILFRDERRTILSWRYLVGSALAVIGVIGVIAFGDGGTIRQHAAAGDRDFVFGVTLVLTQAFLWACYTLSMKRVVRHTRPLVGFSIIATFTTGYFLLRTVLRSVLPAPFFSDHALLQTLTGTHPDGFLPAQFLAIGLREQIMVITSGLAFIAVAHSLYFRAVQRLGVGICASFLLVQPFAAAAISWLWHGEVLRPGQVVMGLILLSGAALIIVTRNPPARKPPSPEGDPASAAASD